MEEEGTRHVVVDIPSLLRQAVATDQDATDDCGAPITLPLHLALSGGQEATAAASGGLDIEAPAAVSAADREAAPGASEGLAAAIINMPAPDYIPPAAGAPNNNPESWITGEGMLFTYMVTVVVEVSVNINVLTGSWGAAAVAVYALLLDMAITSSVLGIMAAANAVVSPTGSRRSVYRRISYYCARVGSVLCTVLLLVYVSCSMGRHGWVAGVLFIFIVLVVSTVIAILISGKETGVAEPVALS